MTPSAYTEFALSTEAKPEKLHIGAKELRQLFATSVAMSDLVDQLKKVVFYGRKPNYEALEEAADMLRSQASTLQWLMRNAALRASWDGGESPDFRVERINKRLLHAAFGKFGEAGELLEALWKQGEGEGFDLINFVEETGDSDWYGPLIYDELGLPEECFRTANVAKLNLVRYVEGFSKEAAKDRKKELERFAISFVIDAYKKDKEADSAWVLESLKIALGNRLNDSVPA